MSRTIRKATISDLPVIERLIDTGRKRMVESGNRHQWTAGYPPREQLLQDVEQGNSYLLTEDGKPIATWAFISGPDETYKVIRQGAWLEPDKPYGVVHRVAADAHYHGIMRAILDWCFTRTDNLRIDTHRDNAPMRHALERYGFSLRGLINTHDGSERVAYQKLED